MSLAFLLKALLMPKVAQIQRGSSLQLCDDKSFCRTGFTFVAWVLNAIFLYKPILGAPKSSFKEWIKDNDGRLIAYAAGIICGLGKYVQIQQLVIPSIDSV